MMPNVVTELIKRETGLGWIKSATPYQVGWVKCILNIPDWKISNNKS